MTFAYTDAKAERTWALGMLTPQGKVETSICTKCRRIFLYGT